MKSKYFVSIIGVALVLAQFAQAGVRYKVLHSFGSGSDGRAPSGPLIVDGNGNLYGTTFTGGTGQSCEYGCGTVFKLIPGAAGTYKETILHSFQAGNGGTSPWGGIAHDTASNLYGTMRGYLSFAIGGVYELSPGSRGWDFDVLYTQGPNGGWSGPGLLMDDLGDLYGSIGNGDGAGAIGELSPGSGDWTYAQLYSFCNGDSCPDGSMPEAPPVWDGKGNMFGTTAWGGIYKGCWLWTEGCGVIYEMTPNGDGTWTYHVLHRFLEHNPKDGQQPYSGLVMDKAGNFYGATANGGQYDQGTVFKLAYTDGRWKETILYDFPNCTDGCGVAGTLAMDKASNLYGTAGGGTGNCGYACGVVFKLSPQKNGTWKYSVVLDLNPETGGTQPLYGVILDGKGNLFGVTSRGGKYGFGTAFEIIP